MKRPTRGVLIGFGSIGKHHASVLQRRYKKLEIVDLDPAARQRALEQYPAATIRSDIKELGPLSDAMIAVATWGPSHEPIIRAILAQGARWILCEKPLATSVADAREIATMAKESGASIGIHQHLRYAGLVNAIRRLEQVHQIGRPVATLFYGGALCVATNGIHWLDLSSGLFEATPESVVSDLKGEPINPRSPTLLHYGGAASWTYPGGRHTTIAFTNASSLSSNHLILYRDAILELRPDLSVVLRRRPAEDIARFPAITRHGRPTQTLHDGPLDGIKEYNLRTEAVLDEIESNKLATYTLEDATMAADAIIGAIAAGQQGTLVRLPIPRSSNLAQTRFPFT